jgi:hypothetical protein
MEYRHPIAMKRTMGSFKISIVIATMCLYPACSAPQSSNLYMETFASEFETVYRISGRMLTGKDARTGVIRMPFGPVFKLFGTKEAPSRFVFEAVEHVLIGAREFRSPPRLGLSRAESCVLLFLKRGEYVDPIWLAGLSKIPVDDPEGGPPWRYHVAQHNDRTILACANEQLHERVSSLLKSQPRVSSEWPSRLERNGNDAAIGTRRFRTGIGVDATAAGLTISPEYQIGPEIESVTVVISDSTVDVELVVRGESPRIVNLIGSRLGIPLQLRERGRVGGNVRVESLQDEQMLRLMSLLGFTLYL